MSQPERFRELLFADLALGAGASLREVAGALEAYWRDGGTPVAEVLERTGALTREARERVVADVERLLAAADGDAAVAVARRGGIDGSLHASVRPETSAALFRNGAGARAPLRTLDTRRYQDFSLVGKGGMGVVYLALDTELNRRVAFKMVRPDPGAPKEGPAPTTPLQATPPSREEARSFDELKARFLQEAWVTGAMEHPGVVPVYELGTTDRGIPFYTMRYVKGERTLATALREAKDLDARLALLEPFLKVCDTVRYAHARGVIHRDLKPENIALGEFGEAVVLDWGLSKMEGRPDVSQSLWRSRVVEFREATDLQTVAGALGTPGYMAPEAALGKAEEVDTRSDVYSLGAILYEILTGAMPFRFTTFMEYVQNVLEQPPPPAHEAAPGVPAALSGIAARALSRKKGERYDSVDDLAREVRRWMTEGRLHEQADELVSGARAELDAARRHTGNMLLWHLDRATASASRVLHLRRDHPEALAMIVEAKSLRDKGIRERVRASRRQVILAVGFSILAVAAIVALAVASILSGQREEAEAQVRAERERLAAKEVEVRSARAAAESAERRRANLYADLARELADGGAAAPARLAAAQALRIAPTPAGLGALAAAEARWTPTLRAVVHDALPGPVALDARAQCLFACGPGNRVRCHDLERGEVREVAAHGSAVRALTVSLDGSRLVTVPVEGAPVVWDTRTGKAVVALPKGVPDAPTEVRAGIVAAGQATAAAFSPDGKRVYTGHQWGAILEWDAESGAVTGVLTVIAKPVTALRVGKSGTYVYVGDAGGGMSRRLARRFTSEVTFETGAGPIVAITGSPNDKVVYACNLDHQIFMLETEDGTFFTHYDGPEGGHVAAVPAPDLKRLYTADERGQVAVWDVDAKALVARLHSFGGRVASLALDGSLLAVATDDGTVRVWDLAMGWRTRGAEPATALVASADGARTWLARPDCSIEAWDGESGRSLARAAGHKAPVTALALDGERARLYSASLDGTLRSWSVKPDGLAAGVSFAGPAAPTALAVLPGGEEIVTGDLSGEIVTWSVAGRRRLALIDAISSPVVRLAAGEGKLVAWSLDGYHEWDLGTRERLNHGTDPALTAAELPRGRNAPPLLGRAEPWVLKDPATRLVEMENRYGLKLEGLRVVTVPRDQYLPHHPRVDPWSR